MRKLVVAFVAALSIVPWQAAAAEPAPGKGEGPGEKPAPIADKEGKAKAKEAKGAKKEGPRFPFGLTPQTVKSDLAGHIELCLDTEEGGEETCFLEPDPDFLIDIAGFHGTRTSVEFARTDDGARPLSKVTLYAGGIEDCDQMVRAYAAAIALVDETYGKPRKVTRGPAYGSKRCGDYMREGRVTRRAEWPDWFITADTFWSEGSYTVYLAIRHRPNMAITEKRRKEARRLREARSLDRL